ncbi:MAG: hypothetical protein ACK496_06145, partial [Acidobacteriota bacterium]
MKRRSFLKAAGMAGPGLTLMAGRRTVAAADKVTIAVIGMNGRVVRHAQSQQERVEGKHPTGC